MYILGLNGWDEKGHDASACLIKEGKIISAAEEERFTRKKHSYDELPINSSAFCLKKSKIDLDKVDIVTIGWDMPKLYKYRNLPWKHSNKELAKKFFPSNKFNYSKIPKFVFVNHHLSHASSAFRTSGFNESSILVVDGQGEDVSTSLWYGEGNQIKLLKTFDISNSIGYFYDALTSFVGLSEENPGKTMGLSSYGHPRFDFREFVKSKKKRLFKINRNLERRVI